MTRKNKRKKKSRTGLSVVGITVGGPTPGQRFQVDLNKKGHMIILSNNPHYCAAIYNYTTKFTPLNELIAIFSHCVKRPK